MHQHSGRIAVLPALAAVAALAATPQPADITLAPVFARPGRLEAIANPDDGQIDQQEGSHDHNAFHQVELQRFREDTERQE